MIDNLLRALPEFKGKRRLARLLFRKRFDTLRDVVIHGRMDCQYLLPNITENVAFSIFINGIYEADTFKFLVKHIPQNGLFLDLGMNIGSISVPLCKRRKDLTVIGVEASPWILKYLLVNIKNNDLEKQVTVFNNALFHEDNIVLPFSSPRDHFGRGSLATIAGAAENIEVNSVRLDTLLHDHKIGKVDFIKIDIEGFEYFAFKGAAQLLSKADAPDILFEFGDWNEKKAGLDPGSSQKILAEFGYQLYLVNGKKLLPVTEILTTGFYMILASKKQRTADSL